MDIILPNLSINLPDSIYNKNPQSSKLGQKILQHSILMIDREGFESFNFKKLGNEIKSNESSIYRYFDNKHKLLVYLNSWYWAWLEYQIVFGTNNIEDPSDVLEKSIEILCSNQNLLPVEGMDTSRLKRIMINENTKAYMTKSVDDENKQGYFLNYKRLVQRIADMIKSKDKNYTYPLSLANVLVETSLHQTFVCQHFHSIAEGDNSDSVCLFLKDLLHKSTT